MNQGIFAFPNITDPNLIDIKEFDVSGSYSIPDGTKLIQVIAIGAGGGGGSGRRRATTAQTCFGGGGGGSGSSMVHTFLREQLDGKVLEIAIGAGGNGAIARTVDNTNGGAGIGGSATTLTLSGKVGFLLYAAGGAGGGAGTTVGGIPGAGRSPMFNGFISNNAGAGGSGTSLTSGSNATYSFFWQKGGAGGSGFSGLGTVSPGGGSIILGSGLVVCNTDYALGAILRTGNSSNAAQSTELDGTGIFVFGKYTGGIGGAGGGAGTTQAATNGGSGWRGGGGGGGGASFSGFNSGAGGRGGNGYVAIFCYK
jgi:hypothetical protein